MQNVAENALSTLAHHPEAVQVSLHSDYAADRVSLHSVVTVHSSVTAFSEVTQVFWKMTQAVRVSLHGVGEII